MDEELDTHRKWVINSGSSAGCQLCCITYRRKEHGGLEGSGKATQRGSGVGSLPGRDLEDQEGSPWQERTTQSG